MSIVDAYVDALDDFIDLEDVDKIRGPGARTLYDTCNTRRKTG